MNLLRDPIWQFVGVIIALSVLVANVANWVRLRIARSTSSLTFEMTNAPLISVADAIKPAIQVTLKGEPIESLTLILLEIRNSGNVAIRAIDFERPISFGFDAPAHVIYAYRVREPASSIDVPISYTTNSVMLENRLLNSGDKFKIAVLVDNFEGKITHDARVVDIKKFKRVDKTERNAYISYVAGGIQWLFFAILAVSAASTLAHHLTLASQIWVSILWGAGITLMYAYFADERNWTFPNHRLALRYKYGRHAILWVLASAILFIALIFW